MYDRIFWLDDNPNFLEWIQILGTELDPSFSIAELLRRITWAYDFETGARIVKERKFDLYILDGDFPRVLFPGRKGHIDCYIKAAKNGNFPDFRFHDGNHDPEHKPWEMYSLFYEQCLTPEQRVILFSLSDAAPILPIGRSAFSRGLPFYTKREKRGETHVRRVIENASGRMIDKVSPEQLASYECGGKADLIERYLLSR